ncbi:hypothetical protein ASF61_18665 [Duganella sp. Leaf126]|uniref:hypothetical protein n=1 Tax=Duganella sp. Leaf126 TaxID=1736266 RepID=UPI0006FE45D0|nr:hypothetical protein [Duganella sp. Leaf126]KQQ46414.1 hypothetical protein ASF61_18665 [Duganella sp. Leaf126]
MNFLEPAFKRIDDSWIETHDYVDWANELLEGGCDAPSVWELASCCLDAEVDAVLVERLFQSCVTELGLELPHDWYDALRTYSSNICQKMLLGEMLPWDCVEKMLAIADDHQQPYIHWIWIDLARDLHAWSAGTGAVFYNGTLGLDDPEECIRVVAKQFIAACALPLPHQYPLIWRCDICEATSAENNQSEARTCTCSRCGRSNSMKNMRFFEHRHALITKLAMRSIMDVSAATVV